MEISDLDFIERNNQRISFLTEDTVLGYLICCEINGIFFRLLLNGSKRCYFCDTKRDRMKRRKDCSLNKGHK